MKPDALRMLARQLRTDPNSEAVEDAAAALEACARERETLEKPFGEILGARHHSGASNLKRGSHRQ